MKRHAIASSIVLAICAATWGAWKYILYIVRQPLSREELRHRLAVAQASQKWVVIVTLVVVLVGIYVVIVKGLADSARTEQE